MKGIIVTAPEVWKRNADEALRSVFIAGGISNCPDWQAAVCERIAGALDVVVINPRRNGWDMGSHEAESIKQITWEYSHLSVSDHVLFWFPRETLCPITLLELGKYLVQKDVGLTIGTHPEYERRLDVEVQTNLERPGTKIWDNLEEMVEDFIHKF